ncbi:HAD family hydrolase [Rubrivirga sp. IMCC43871]|uniref:HAD family hydrolase n=1 Tax=Rubrivirga sp. IMCC43871 TaxID=3391575 RepID=UPI00398FF5C0
MLDLLAFDLDGTLADTEPLKAESYAWAATRLRPGLDAAEVEAAYNECVGQSRQQIATALLNRFDLADAARAHDGSVEPWRSFVGIRLARYQGRLADGEVVRANAHAQAIALVRRAHTLARSVALVTTSGRENATLVLAGLGLSDTFDLTVTADDVSATKPDPEGYLHALATTGSAPGRSVAVEDSPAGTRAALAAGIGLVVVPDDLTREGIARLVADGTLDAGAVTTADGLADAVETHADRVAG